MGTDVQRNAHPGRVLIPITAFLLLGGALYCLMLASFMTEPASVATWSIFGSALLLASSGFLGEVVLSHVRARAQPWQRPAETPLESSTGPWSILRAIREHYQRVGSTLAGVDWVGAWSPIAMAFVGSLLAAGIAIAMWPTTGRMTTGRLPAPWIGCALIVMAFPLLVLDRLHARLDKTAWAAAPSLENLLRIPLVVSVGLGIASILHSLGYAWPYLIHRVLILLVSVVAIEIMLRSVARIFLPMPPVEERRTSAASAIARLLALRWPRLADLGAGIQQQFGIDLSRSWAMAFVARASLPMFVGFCVLGWLLTGLTALSINQRAVYERFGVPVAIEGPGLHLHLPWPFGIMRKVELGVVHEMPIVFPTTPNGIAADAIDAPADAQTSPAEAIPSASEDRLWDDSHPFEASYLIPSTANGLQGFQIVNIDLRIVYRTSLSDQGAMAAAYRVTDPEALIRAAAGRMLVQHFSRYTLADVLGENRARFVSSFRDELQQRLDQLQTGTDIIAVVVEAIHPPPEAAASYHNVQAAQIKADALISQSRGTAFVALSKAQQTVDSTLDTAKADSAEQVNQAQAALTLFHGDHQAYLRGGDVFLTERWFNHLSQDLPKSPLVIVDHRMNNTLEPTVDLRRFSPSATPPSVIPEP
ncbi:MAG TPA: protease modulator HflK [Dyella sp.]|uniref:protease modulator HflK n=1 Tax=Dyella sp. TaxID=1869338 RepID=UPI002BE3444F|nr:protease modulator HflK [Dyella sp.]HUB90535.1 protease modulator HflK [Dyella sp.]